MTGQEHFNQSLIKFKADLLAALKRATDDLAAARAAQAEGKNADAQFEAAANSLDELTATVDVFDVPATTGGTAGTGPLTP